MSGGETNPANTIAYIIAEAVSGGGLIVTRGATAGYMKLAAAASTDEPMGYTYSGPLVATGGSAAPGNRVGVHALIEGQKAEFVLPATHSAVTYGAKMCVTTDGKVIPYVSGASWVVGDAEEGVLQNVGGYVEVRVSKRYIAA